MSKIVCFGEVLWDVFPTHKKIGGAPLNVALRLKSFGNDVTMISSVGNDLDGKKIIEHIKNSSLDTEEIQITNYYKTSYVNVTLDDKKSATYEIEFPCAWDYIRLTESSKTLAKQSDVFAFGSLIARNNTSKETLYSLLKLAKFKVFDVNLRAPHYNMVVLNKLMLEADFIKFNDEELIEICAYFDFKSSKLEDHIKFISNKTNTNQICVTLGGKGAILYTTNKIFKNPGYKVIVKDTVGAGDSFLASLVHRLISNDTPQVALDYACAIGALVASENGANPKINNKDIISILN